MPTPMRAWVSFGVLILIGLVSTGFAAEEEAAGPNGFSFGFRWDSRYVSQGREILGAGGLYSGEAEYERAGFSLTAWYGYGDAENPGNSDAEHGDTEHYREFDAQLGYGIDIGTFHASVGYNRYEYLSDHLHDNVLTAGLSYESVPWLVPAADYIYSIESHGAFGALSVHSELPLITGYLTVTPFLLEEFDFGYNSKEDEGPNDLQAGVEAAFAVTASLELKATGAHLWAQQEMKRAGLGDVTWGSIGISGSFDF